MRLHVTLAASLFGLAGLGAFGCSNAPSEDTQASPDRVTAAGDTSALLKSTLILGGGCTAAKVGPKQLLVSARCVTGNDAFAVGTTLTFTSAASGKTIESADPSDTDAGAAPAADGGSDSDSGASDETETDGGAPAPADDAGATSTSARDVTIADVTINPSYVAKCAKGACGLDEAAASDAADVAVITLSDELATVPSIPVDLDPVGEADPVFVLSSACSTLDANATAAPKLLKTLAVPAKSADHDGSPYEATPAFISRLAASYVITPGAGWHKSDPHLCRSDVGSPLFRAGSAAVAGITANYTTYADGKQPVTTHHTRVDAMSRFKIGDWLTTLGVETIHSCSTSAGGCVKHSWDGGVPSAPSDSTAPGTDGGAAPLDPDGGVTDDGSDPTADPGSDDPRSDQLPSEDPGEDEYSDSDEDYSDSIAPTKKKKAAAGGCSTAPGAPLPTGDVFLGLGLVLGAGVIRRRRSSAKPR